MRAAGLAFIAFGFLLFVGFVWAMWQTQVERADEGGQYAYDYADTPVAEKGEDAGWLDDLAKTKSPSTGEEWANLDAVEFAAAVRRDDYTYKVRVGDTLESLAKKFLSDETLSERIVEANPDLESSRLLVGTEIVIPFRYRRP